ncbi:arginine/serine-rich coiled-coil protein 2-like [Malaya genurostris]|uniref:arginine/serine-rich coiled-coil protein 2-like n=1 Tax=Malaya genurostris TaxID=325434 RepID=UPI0026F3CB15|nr:arginine/serine-rich coiled-coil protein 2-like [Malaya genurostris]
MLPSILRVLQNTDGYVPMEFICDSIQGSHSETVPGPANMPAEVRKHLEIAQQYGLVTNSADETKILLKLTKPEPPNFELRLETLKREIETENQRRNTSDELVESTAGPSHSVANSNAHDCGPGWRRMSPAQRRAIAINQRMKEITQRRARSPGRKSRSPSRSRPRSRSRSRSRSRPRRKSRSRSR